MLPAAQIETAPAQTLKTTRIGSLNLSLKRKKATTISKATVRVPAQVPKRRTEAKTNVSETDSRACSFGTLIVKEPLNRVSAARMSQSARIGCCTRELTQWDSTAKPLAETIRT